MNIRAHPWAPHGPAENCELTSPRRAILRVRRREQRPSRPYTTALGRMSVGRTNEGQSSNTDRLWSIPQLAAKSGLLAFVIHCRLYLTALDCWGAGSLNSEQIGLSTLLTRGSGKAGRAKVGSDSLSLAFKCEIKRA